MPRDQLGVFEEELLRALLRTSNENYALTIARTIEAQTGRRAPSLGAVYTALDRMTDKGLVTSGWSEPDNKRGGRRKRIYQITAHGASVLQAQGILAPSHQSWQGAPA
ncbi:PadR family transcriptional regulator [Brevundimonas sp.]|uniref:PadR family transcriptional regulator n=1 Tax=Brevundimonas sp. TaxID=1871086 RepID=UPI003F719230